MSFNKYRLAIQASRNGFYGVVASKFGYDWNSYSDMQDLEANSYFFGRFGTARKNQLYYYEKKRSMDDTLKSWGLSPDDSAYPILDYYSQLDPVGYNDYFEASEAVINQFDIGRKLARWR